MPLKRFINACPNCGSTNYHKESDISWMTGNPGIYVCNDCNYSANLFPEVEEKGLKIFKSKVKKKKIRHTKQKSIKIDSIIVLILAIIVLFFLGVVFFVIIIGGYFTIKHLFFKDK